MGNEIRLRRVRVAKGLKQAELAALAGVDQATISNIERGKGTSIAVLRKICDAMGADISEVLGRDDLEDRLAALMAGLEVDQLQAAIKMVEAMKAPISKK